MSKVNFTGGGIPLAQIFIGEHEVWIDCQGLATAGDADPKAARLTVAITRRVEHTGVILVLNCGKHLHGPVILAEFGQIAALLINILGGQNA